MEYIHLLGSEEVSRAASNIRSAAEQMSRAAATMDDTLYRHRQFMDDWLQRFESALMPKEKTDG